MMEETSAQKESSLVAALVMVGLGIIFLLNNFGLLDWRVWSNLWRFWPLFLILIGLRILFGRSRLAMLAIFLIGLVLVAGAVALSVTSTQYGFNYLLK